MPSGDTEMVFGGTRYFQGPKNFVINATVSLPKDCIMWHEWNETACVIHYKMAHKPSRAATKAEGSITGSIHQGWSQLTKGQLSC